MEANAVYNLERGVLTTLDLLAGIRYLNLDERLTVSTDSTNLALGTHTSTLDSFAARNQFYGGQLGLRGQLEGSLFWSSLTIKLAFGSTEQTLDINGSTISAGAGAAHPGFYSGGVLTQPSNIGHFSHTSFSVVPEVSFQTGVIITSYLKAFIAYDVVNWSGVMRVGSNIDQSVNLTQSLGGTLSGPVHPIQQTTTSTFWAQGVSLGFLFEF
jgi:hypothetical protein